MTPPCVPHLLFKGGHPALPARSTPPDRDIWLRLLGARGGPAGAGCSSAAADRHLYGSGSKIGSQVISEPSIASIAGIAKAPQAPGGLLLQLGHALAFAFYKFILP